VWVGLAIVAHIGNALVFVIDKGLLSSDSKISEPVRLAYFSGIVSLGAAILLPWAWVPPTGWLLGWSAVSGIFFLAALWLFFTALKRDEPSRVVPLIGSAVPLFTLLFAVLVLGEELTIAAGWGVGLLIVGGALLSVSWRGTRGLSAGSLWLTVAGGAAFAAHFATVKFVYDGFQPFLAAFAYNRIVTGLLAAALLGPVVWLLGRSGSRKRTGSKRGVIWYVVLAFLASKVLSATAFLVQNYAISLGSVTVVNALQGIQYVFLLLLAVVVSRWWPKLFTEELQRVAVAQKIGGIALISLGLALIL